MDCGVRFLTSREGILPRITPSRLSTRRRILTRPRSSSTGFFRVGGQLVYQESHGDRDSLRVDIPKDKVPAGMRRVAGRNYFFVEGPEFIDVKPALKIVEDALAEKARPQ